MEWWGLTEPLGGCLAGPNWCTLLWGWGLLTEPLNAALQAIGETDSLSQRALVHFSVRNTWEGGGYPLSHRALTEPTGAGALCCEGHRRGGELAD